MMLKRFSGRCAAKGASPELASSSSSTSIRLRVMTIGAAAAILSAVALVPPAQAMAPTDTIQTRPGETLQCASARHALKRFMPKRGPMSVRKALEADQERACATTTELVERWDGTMEEKTTMVDLPLEIPQGWRGEQLKLVNDTRAKHGRNSLRACPRLEKAAQKYAEVMAKTGHFGHTGLDGSSPTVRAKRANYRGGAGENIGAGYNTNAEVMEGWIRSTGHYRNILYPRYKDAGFGAAISKTDTIYWVQMFGVGGSCQGSR
jgi:uncharacterized protein YkwD